MDRIQRALELARTPRVAPAGVDDVDDEGCDLARPELLAGYGRAQADPRDSAPGARLTLDRAALSRNRVVFGSDRGPAARAYRMLRAQVLQRVRASGARTIGVVSAAAGEGKTLTAINLALSLAMEPNQSVSLVDLDLRHPGIAETLGIEPTYGLDSWLHDDSPVSAVAYELEGVERLRVVPTLAPVIASSEALAEARIGELLLRLRNRHPSELLIIDQAPALLSDDVLTLAPQLDGYLLVATEKRTLRGDVARVFELLGRERLIGTVFNGSADSELRAY
jgi:Mrp family chromosome partitioning ATPase